MLTQRVMQQIVRQVIQRVMQRNVSMRQGARAEWRRCCYCSALQPDGTI
jgi:hypothetical protein